MLKTPLALAVLVFGYALSAPALACLCDCWGSAADTEITAAEYDQVFSGIVISTERIDRAAEVASTGEVDESPGYWIRSRVLVLRIWRGAPPLVAEVWTPVATSCDTHPITGFYFLALVRSEEGRDVALSTFCDCALKAAATEGRGSFSIAGMTITATSIGVVALALISLVKVFRRRRQSVWRS